MPDCVVQVQQGKLQGKTVPDFKGNHYYSFQGIPYAKPPVGDLRFKAPVPPEPWTGVRDATVEASECISRDFFFPDKTVGSEDCLYLNVYSPKLPKDGDSLKPVMFWIHGGGFTKGSSRTEIYGPEYLVTGHVVLVTINYRLGALGFLRCENPNLGVPGNAGMKDMVMALKWVKQNISKFGGDPENVTIFGESAGSASVHALLLSPMGKGLFHRAIMQSGCIFNPWVFGEGKVETLAQILGCDSKNEEDMLKFLRSVPGENILEAQLKIPEPDDVTSIRPFGLVIENASSEPAFLSKHPVDIIKSGDYNKVPLMIGYTTREGMYALVEQIRAFGEIKINPDMESCIPYFYNVQKGTNLSLNIAKKIKEAYFGSSDISKEKLDDYLKLQTDIYFFAGIYETIKYHTNNLNLPIYFYTLSAETKMNLVKVLGKLSLPGVCHADDIGYLFKTNHLPEVEENSPEELIITRMVQLWTNFAKAGNPNSTEGDKLVTTTWKPVDSKHFHYLDIGAELKCTENSDIARLKVWDEIQNLVRKS